MINLVQSHLPDNVNTKINTAKDNVSNYCSNNVNCALGTVFGYATSRFIDKFSDKAKTRFLNRFSTFENSLTDLDNKQIIDSVNKAIKDTGIDKKGVEVYVASNENINQIIKFFADEVNSGCRKFLPKETKSNCIKEQITQVLKSQNAFFESNKIILPAKGLHATAFHELGHALNKNKGIVGKMLKSCRPLLALNIPIMLVSLLKTKKDYGDKKRSKFDKVTDFIKYNAGKLTFLAFLPCLAEEALATIKGSKYAKATNNKQIIKAFKAEGKLGFMSYAFTALSCSISAYLAVKVKDTISGTKKVSETKQ